MVSGDRHHAEALREEVAAVIAPLGSRLSPEKTRVVHIDEGPNVRTQHSSKLPALMAEDRTRKRP
jgi:RNA-directed DNA polymerase